MRKSLVAIGASVAGAALFNRAVTIDRSDLEEQLPVAPDIWHWRFGDVAVYRSSESAASDKPPLVLLHGHNAAASAHEMRRPFELLADDYRIYAPDLLGYGLSDRPDINYTPELYINFISDFLREVVGKPAIVVASSLTSAYAIEAALANRDWITHLVLICPTGVRRLRGQPASGKITEAILRLPVFGEALFNGIASRPSIRYFLESQTYYDRSLVTPELVERNYRTAHVPGAYHAPSAFVSGKLYYDASDAWSRLEQGVLLVWGREASITPVSDAAAFLATNPRAELQEISPAGLLPHDEQPEQFANLVRGWLARQE